MNEYILALITSGALSALIGALVAAVQSKSMMRNALKQILYYQIKQACERAIEKNEIDREELQATHEAWKTYHSDLKGNGYLNALMNKIDNLPIK